MPDQTTLNPPLETQPGFNEAPAAGTQPPDSGMNRNVASFGSDLVQLMDLQAALVKADARDAVKKCIAPTALFMVGLILLLGMFPILMAGVAALLAENGWAWSTALLTVAGGSVVLAILLGLGGWLSLRFSRGAFTRSIYEWNRNKKWLTESLKQRF